MSSKTINQLTNNYKNNSNSKVDIFLEKINSKNNSKIILEKYNKTEDESLDDLEKDLSELDSESDEIDKIDKIDKIDQIDQLDQMEQLEYELETKYNIGLPKNYGLKWSQNEISIIFEKLKKGEIKDLTESNNCIKKIAKKLNRSVGGVYVIIKKTIFDKYINGQESESISNEFNITFQSVKSIIKSFISFDSDNTINLLEKENKLLKLKIENVKLKKELKELS